MSKENPKPEQSSFGNFILIGAVSFPLLVVVNTLWLRAFISKNDSIFYVLAASIVLSWILILTLYYVWAIYFYNVNLGWTDRDWRDQESKLMANPKEQSPEDNPHSGETLGLPPGTVRGTIALSVLVGGLAMLIASLAMPGKYSHNEFLVDNFEYVKTAFLMVIAFYFGSKSLEFIDRKQILNAPARPGQANQSAPSNTTSPPVHEASTEPVMKTMADVSTGNQSDQKSFDDKDAKG